MKKRDRPEGSGPTIDLNVVREALNLSLDALEHEHGTAIELLVDYYWSIPSPDRFDPYVEPANLTIGQASELYEHVDALVKDPGSAIAHHAVWAAQLLELVASQNMLAPTPPDE